MEAMILACIQDGGHLFWQKNEAIYMQDDDLLVPEQVIKKTIFTLEKEPENNTWVFRKGGIFV